MKASSALVCAFAFIASVDAFKTIATKDGVRVLSSASSVKQNDGGKMTMATDTLPQVTNGGVNFYPYSSDIRQYIVDAHNRARAEMVPTSAANMRQVAWDESLAIEAAELVNTCVFEHATENYAYGQNLMYGGRVLDRATVDGWMDGWVRQEISAADRAGNGYMDLDHASAVLWANSYLVGCASKMCPNGYLTACNYYTPGNWQGERTFIPGTPCSQCPTQAPYCDATFGKLCTANQPTTPTSAPVPVTPVPTRPVPVPTPAKTTNAPSPGQSVPPPTPAATTPRPLPTPSKTQSQADQKATETPAPIWQRPIDITSAPVDSATSVSADSETPAPVDVETPEPTDDTGKWTNVEDSPATKPLVSSVVAAVSALLLIARAM